MVVTVTSTSLRLIAAVVLALTLLAGVYLSGKTRRDAQQRLADLRAGVDRSEQDAAAQAQARPPELDPQRFEQALREDLLRFGLTPITAQELAQPNAYFDEVPEPVTLGPGSKWSSAHVRIKVRLDKVEYMQRGARVSSMHAVARAENISSRPIAYLLRMRGEAGQCEVRGAREHNAVTLRPGESAEIVVCAGRDRVVVERLEVLEVTDLGYHYLSQVSPLALGHDATTAAAHEPLVKVDTCPDLDTRTLAAYLQAGTATWADVVDFYSRHDCHRLQFFPGYRWAQQALPSLPAIPSQ
jgi:outer membrane murein-binding lipoprotein Lpp